MTLVALGLVAHTTGCATSGESKPKRDTYIKYVAWELPFNENVLLRWPKRQMPLRVHLPAAPAELFEDPKAIEDAVRAGVLDWTGVAGPGLPRFEFVDDPGDADIPIVWADSPDGAWYIAFCSVDVNWTARRFAVSHILVTARWGDGRVAEPNEVHEVMLHEMGHALGFAGHSPNPDDIMYKSARRREEPTLSERDRATLELLYERPIGKRIVGAKR